MAAAWMARCGINTRIIDKREEKISRGQADGLQSRTLEIFDSFGFGQQVFQEANHMLEMCLWNPDQNGQLKRSSVVIDTIPGLSRFTHCTLNQGQIEDFFLTSLQKHSNIKVERSIMPELLELNEDASEDPDAYPIAVSLRSVDHEGDGVSTNGSVTPNGLFRSNLTADDTASLLQRQTGGPREIVKAKYVIGCDGAHSWVRKQLGIEMEGEHTDYIWFVCPPAKYVPIMSAKAGFRGVLDIVPITDFPDIRKRCAIHSASSGSVMIIPRENKLTRIYCQLQKTSHGKRIDSKSISPELILSHAQKILAPYKLEYKHCNWYTAYQIGQRVASKFSYKDRIFLAGDAVHTHSPKAGQGMNVSMHDTYNLGWKIASVVQNISKRSILNTYQAERRRVAQDLIDFDHKFSRMFSGRPAKDENDQEGVNMSDFKATYEKSNLFTCGLAVEYGRSVIVAGDRPEDGLEQSSLNRTGVVSKQHLAHNIKIGMRMPSYQVLNQADARPWHLQETLKSNGRWRVVVFAGDVSIPSQMRRIHVLGAKLNFLVRRFTPPAASIDSCIEVITVHKSPRLEIELFDFPPIMRPFREDVGWDYEKIFVDAPSYHQGDAKAYEKYGIDSSNGCIVLVRPDQYVSFIGGVEDVKCVGEFLAGFMNEQQPPTL